MSITKEEVREAVADTVKDIIADFKDEPDTDREALIERLDEECDKLFGNLVYQGPISQWDTDTLAQCAGDCAAIIEVAKKDAWVKNYRGLWEGMKYGLVGAIAFYSLRNLLYQAMKDAGHDSNDDMPFAKEE